MPSTTNHPSLFSGTKAVAAAATPEALTSAANNIPFTWIDIQAHTTGGNTVTVQLTGDAAVRGITIYNGEVYPLGGKGAQNSMYNTQDIYIRVSNDGDSVSFLGGTT